MIRPLAQSHWLDVFDSFFRVGSLVFGGGHVVLPLLQTEVVGPGWITNEQFVAGYGATQAVPGPLFTFSAYLGAVMNGWSGGVIDSGRYLSAVVSTCRWRVAVLGSVAGKYEFSIGAERRQRRGCWLASGCALSAGVDECDSLSCRFRAWLAWIRTADVLEWQPWLVVALERGGGRGTCAIIDIVVCTPAYACTIAGRGRRRPVASESRSDDAMADLGLCHSAS